MRLPRQEAFRRSERLSPHGSKHATLPPCASRIDTLPVTSVQVDNASGFMVELGYICWELGPVIPHACKYPTDTCPLTRTRTAPAFELQTRIN